ncbi:MAG TPA: radical SAM protein [Candidatus Nanoarchaeia archaeon]|nr:radical SAM protein [Candidatus Nanoarchaeia archaeon]
MVASKGAKRSRIILVYPRVGTELGEFGGAIGMPYSILTAAAELNDSFDLVLIDQRIDKNWKQTLADAMTPSCLCVGVSSMTGTQLKYALDIARETRAINPKIPIVWGGIHVTILPEQSLKDPLADIVIRGEGESTFLELAQALEAKKSLHGILGLYFKENGKIIANPPRPPLDMNTLKPIPWKLVNPERYIMKGQLTKNTKREFDIGETSRGCPYTCTFCYNSQKTHFTWRAMSPEKTVSVIKDAIKRFNIDGFWMRDDNFFVDFKRVDKILELLKKERISIPWYCPGIRIDTVNRLPQELLGKLIKSKVRRFRIGVESGSARSLKLINKLITPKDIIAANLRLGKSKIPVEYSYIIGFPTETLEDMYETVDLMLQLKKDNPYSVSHNINIYTPYPGTVLYEKALQMGLKEPKTMEKWSEYHHLSMNFSTYTKKEEKIMKNINELSYYCSGIVYDNLPPFLRALSLPLRLWSDLRLKMKWLTFRTDLEIVKFVRQKFMRI